ncbi:MAG TPA: hypothetical protein PLU06_00005 [Candidatus Syntrophosphaera sp.]|nr:hypothetical protein [Candidatus Syntrophosphaera sp.]
MNETMVSKPNPATLLPESFQRRLAGQLHRPENQIEFTIISFSWRNVMKKLILPLLLLVAFGMLAAVESDPSNIVGYVKYPCAAGVNSTIALPMEEAYTLASEIGDAYAATSIGYWSPADGTWMMIDQNPWGGWADDFAVANGDPLIMYVDAAVDFYSIGDLPAVLPDYDLVGGVNNTIMMPLNKSDLNLASLAGDDIVATSIGYWSPVDGTWMMVDQNPWGGWADDFPVAIGDHLVVYVDADTTWPAPAPAPLRSK